eukprot:14896667-Ditylum_brightwellii.AAC.1
MSARITGVSFGGSACSPMEMTDPAMEAEILIELVVTGQRRPLPLILLPEGFSPNAEEGNSIPLEQKIVRHISTTLAAVTDGIITIVGLFSLLWLLFTAFSKAECNITSQMRMTFS